MLLARSQGNLRRFCLLFVLQAVIAVTAIQSHALDSFGLTETEHILEINRRIDDILVYSSSVTIKEGAGPTATRLDSDIKALLEKHEKLRQAYAVRPSETTGIIEDLLNYLDLQ